MRATSLVHMILLSNIRLEVQNLTFLSFQLSPPSHHLSHSWSQIFSWTPYSQTPSHPHKQQVPRLTMCGAIPPILHTSSWRT